MSSTNVHSEQNTVSSAIVAGSAFKVTQREFEFPPKSQVFKAVSTYIEEQGNIEIAAEDGFVTENGDLIKKDGSISKLKSSQAYNNLKLAKKEREKLSPKQQKQTEQSER